MTENANVFAQISSTLNTQGKELFTFCYHQPFSRCSYVNDIPVSLLAEQVQCSASVKDVDSSSFQTVVSFALVTTKILLAHGQQYGKLFWNICGTYLNHSGRLRSQLLFATLWRADQVFVAN